MRAVDVIRQPPSLMVSPVTFNLAVASWYHNSRKRTSKPHLGEVLGSLIRDVTEEANGQRTENGHIL